MLKTKETIYQCEYCKRKMFSRGAMTLHERQCNKNPKNRHMCFKYCLFLEKSNSDIGDVDFTCGNKLSKYFHKKLYSYKLERFFHNADRLKEMVRMPLKCMFYEIENGHEKSYIKKIKDEN